jgi:hypothetical protein
LPAEGQTGEQYYAEGDAHDPLRGDDQSDPCNPFLACRGSSHRIQNEPFKDESHKQTDHSYNVSEQH